MADSLTAEQVLALAPDSSSAKAGKGLATARKWSALGRNEQALWGECQGSGSSPYKTQIDLSEPAFRCSCPSRKFPCKHGLGLLLLLVDSPTLFPTLDPPPWVAEWLSSRAQKVERQAKKAERVGQVSDEAAQAKRAAERTKRVAAGLRDLELWLRDLMRGGLASVQGKPYTFWDAPAARLVDAQAPGLARMVRELASIPVSGEGWQERLLAALSSIHLIIEGFKRIDALPPPVQADLRTAVGWTLREDDLRGEEGQRDRWLILGQRVEGDDKLRVQRTWLCGATNAQSALILDFAALNQPLDKSLLPGATIEAELVFYPSNFPQRAFVKTRSGAPETQGSPTGFAHLHAATGAYAEALARSPWIEQFPLVLEEALIVADSANGWLLRDATGHSLPIARRFGRTLHLLALTGGHPTTLFGEWNGNEFLPLSVWVGMTFYPIGEG